MMRIKFALLVLFFLPFVNAQVKDISMPGKMLFIDGKYIPEEQSQSDIKEPFVKEKKHSSISWSEGFEGQVFPPLGWAVFEPKTASVQNWSRYVTTPIFGKASASVRYEAGTNPLSNDDWLITPKFLVNSGDVFCFWAKGAASMFDDSLEIFYSFDENLPPAGFVKISCIKVSLLNLFKIPLNFLTGKNVRLAFHYKENNQYRVYVDSVYVNSSAPKDAAVKNININNDLPVGIVKPKVKIKNYGYLSAPFSVKLIIKPGNYESVKTVSNIMQFEDSVIAFDDWNAAAGSFTASAQIIFEGDEQVENDTLSKNISVSNVLFDNGSIVNYPFSGPDGSDGSVLEAPLNAYGYNNSVYGNFRVAEDFTVPKDTTWCINSITFYAYQTGSYPFFSPFTSVNYRIWKGIPDGKGSVLVYGDLFSNKMVSSGWAESYRYYENAFSTLRPVYAINASAEVHLSPGTYWIDWQCGSSAVSWVPPVTIKGVSVTGNAMQFDGGWKSIKDSTLFVFGSYPQGLPFKIKGEIEIASVPVELTFLNAELTGDKIQIRWSTSTETNNAGFYIERKDEYSDYKIIGYVPGTGTSSKVTAYSFMDANIKTGEYIYRLKQVDFDGSVSYSKEAKVSANIPCGFSLNQNYPNPFNPSTNICFSVPEEGSVILNVYNVLGQQVKCLSLNGISQGEHSIKFNAEELNSGVYFYSLNVKTNSGLSFSAVRKMILAK